MVTTSDQHPTERTHQMTPTQPERARAEAAAISDRDQVLDQAVRDGKFFPRLRAAYAARWDKDPAGTRRTIASLGEFPNAAEVFPDEYASGEARAAFRDPGNRLDAGRPGAAVSATEGPTDYPTTWFPETNDATGGNR